MLAVKAKAINRKIFVLIILKYCDNNGICVLIFVGLKGFVRLTIKAYKVATFRR